MKKRYTTLLILLALLILAGIVVHLATTQSAPEPLQLTEPALVLLPEPSTRQIGTTAPTSDPFEEQPEAPVETAQLPTLDENGSYNSKDEVALYIHLYGKLPQNYLTKREAEALGWPGGSLEPYAPGKSIGGGYFGNYEGLLPEAPGRKYTECDIDTEGKSSRGAKRIVFSNDGLIYYTDDHYETFELLYGEVD